MNGNIFLRYPELAEHMSTGDFVQCFGCGRMSFLHPVNGLSIHADGSDNSACWDAIMTEVTRKIVNPTSDSE